ncbi:MAG: MFS transporter [Parvibaculum sp.]|nr:MFS transporter [Parvibaculum sp.]
MTAPLSRSSIYIHGSIGLPIAMFGYPVAVWLPPFYAGELGVSLAAVGTMIMLARLTDVITDPLIGYFSDHTHTRIGRRKPFMLVGLPILVIGVLFLFMPHMFGFTSVGGIYLLAWLGIMFIGSTLVYIPYLGIVYFANPLTLRVYNLS